MNRLQFETSPYLRQHAENPVDWYAWGEEALSRARAEDKPILLSIGYSACHWCHVMAHESFEDAATAALMNERYINIKVDREERPDIDDIYMQAVQAFTGHGGWPMTMFLLPDGRPFYGGTYYPPTPRHGMPAFTQILEGVHQAYSARRDEVEKVAADITLGLDRGALNIGGGSVLDEALLEAAAAGLLREFDMQHGGTRGAPKFPQPMALEFLLKQIARKDDPDTLTAITHSLEKMANGGIYDQIGGGFHRYSVDAIWLVPHFEKMLYDNAQLSRVYLHAWQYTGNPFFRRIAAEIYDYILREMTASHGGFYSATDADSEGEEGKFFVWSREELQSLPGDDARIAIEYWGVTARGNFEGANILHVPNDEAVVAERLGLSVEVLRERLTAIRDRLYAVRTQRIAPGLDDKILAAWNGMMLASLAEAARVLKDERYLEAAQRCGDFIRAHLLYEQDVHEQDGALRVWRTYQGDPAVGGRAHINGYLEDYAHLIDAFLELYQSTFDETYFVTARKLADATLIHFRADDGGFFDTPDDGEKLIVRPRALQDNATPAGSTILAGGLARLAAYTGDGRYDDAARATLTPLANAMQQYPIAFGEGLKAADAVVRGIAEIAVIGRSDDARTAALLDTVQTPYRPNIVTAHAETDILDQHPIPLLHHRTMREGAPTAYVCRHFACQLPVTTPEDLRAQLG